MLYPSQYAGFISTSHAVPNEVSDLGSSESSFFDGVFDTILQKIFTISIMSIFVLVGIGYIINKVQKHQEEKIKELNDMLNKQSKDVTHCAKNNSNSEIEITNTLFEKLFLAHECKNTKFLINYLEVTLLSNDLDHIQETIKAVSFTPMGEIPFRNSEKYLQEQDETYQAKKNVKFLPDIGPEIEDKGRGLTTREFNRLNQIINLIQQSQNDITNYLSYRDTTLASVKEAFVTAGKAPRGKNKRAE